MAARQEKTEPIDRLARSVDLLVRLKLHEIRGQRSQKEMVLLLGQAGASGGEIASLLGISRTNVDPILSKARSSSTKQRGRGMRQKRQKG
jgi:DNA-directed RNA polymerase specialized sigma24 family protein